MIRSLETKRHGTRYQVIVIVKDPVTNRPCKRTEVCATEREARRLEAEWILEAAKGKLGPRTIHTVSDLCATWLEQYASAKSVTTYDGYERSVRLYIAPHLGHLKAGELTTERVRAWVTRLRKAGKSHRTVTLALLNLHQVMKYAMGAHIVAYDATEGVTVPSPEGRGEEMHVWTADEAQRFLDVADQHLDTYGPVFLVALSTGMRSGELRGLRWSDVDWERSYLHIRQGVTTGPHQHGLQVGPLKNKSSRRDVLVDGDVLDALKAHRVRQLEWRARLGPVWEGKEYDLVFCSQVGTPLNASNLWKLYRKIRLEADVPKITIHDQRHTHITWALEEHADLKTVSERAGHSSITVTVGIYQHTTKRLQEELVSKVAGKLSRPRDERRAQGQ